MDLNICLMNDSFPPTIDGVANAVLNYAENITAAGERCAVATPAYPDVRDDYPFPVVRYPSLNTTQLTGYRAGVPFAPETVVRLADMKFDLIHTHCPIASTVLARSLRDASPMPIVFTYHTKFDIDIANAIRSERLQQLAVDLLVRNISACDEVWVVSEGAGENLRALGYTGDYRVMPNGVDLERGRASVSDTAALSAAWDLPADQPVYLFLGRMMWYKGLRIILDGLKRMQEAGRAFCMVFVGDGQDRDEVEEYAASLGLSGDILTAVGDILGGEPVGFDVGCFNDRYFIYVAAFGAFTDVSYSTDQGMKNSLGHFAYLLEATKKLGDVKPFRMQVQVNGHTMTHSYIYGMVTNSFSVGGMKNLLFTDKEVHLSDGMFEVMLIRDPKNLMDLQQIVGAILTRNFDTQLIDIYKTSEISFESPEPLPWTLDGEYGGDDRTVTITNRKEGVRIMLDRGQERPSEEGKADHE